MAVLFIFQNFGYNALILQMTIFFQGNLKREKNWQKMKAFFSIQTAKFHSEHNGAIMFTIGYLLCIKLLNIRVNRTMY